MTPERLFRHRLALALGKTLEEIEEMTYAEFRSWTDFYGLEPFGDIRADLRAGIVAATITRMMGAKGTRPKPIDFMPIVREQMARQRAQISEVDSTAELRAAMLAGFKGRLKVVKIQRERAQ